jgi:hypothetical protein
MSTKDREDFLLEERARIDAELAQLRKPESTPDLKVPPFQMTVAGEYQGNAYPEQREYVVHMIEGDDETILLSVEDAAGNEVNRLTFSHSEAHGVLRMASTDHSLSGYEDEIPTGVERHLTWDLGSGEVYLVLSDGEIDETAAWLSFALGESEWIDGDEWVY